MFDESHLDEQLQALGTAARKRTQSERFVYSTLRRQLDISLKMVIRALVVPVRDFRAKHLATLIVLLSWRLLPQHCTATHDISFPKKAAQQCISPAPVWRAGAV